MADHEITESNTPAVRTESVWKIFEQEAEEVHAVQDVSLTIERGEFTALAGPSGSGKTTLLNVIGGLTRPTRGRVWVAGQEVSEMSNQDLAQLRLEQVGFVFQAYNLLPVLTAMENAEFPMLLQGVAEQERAARIGELFERTGMSGLENRRPGKLSGGQQQRVAVARAFANDPAIILADEPTGNLDLTTGTEIIELLRQMNKESGVAVISATHDHKMLSVSDRVIWVRDGLVDRIINRADLKIQVGTIDGAAE